MTLSSFSCGMDGTPPPQMIIQCTYPVSKPMRTSRSGYLVKSQPDVMKSAAMVLQDVSE
jgi:hypothetical protein